MKIELGYGYSLQDETHGFSIAKMVPVKSEKGLVKAPPKLDENGEPVMKERKGYYGTVYQALQGYIDAVSGEADSIDGIRKNVASALIEIGAAKETIRKHFRVEVRIA